MALVKTSEYQRITKELYKKNLELVNANKVLTLLQQLYRIMMVVSTMEELTQGFINVITSTLKFRSGMVAIEKAGRQLRIIAVTQSEINNTASKLIGSSLSQATIPLHEKNNILVETFQTGKKRTTHDILEIWKPLVSQEKLKEVAEKTDIQSTLVYPIIFGEETLGIFSVSLGRDAQDMTRFEKRVLRRVATLFGIAIDRIKISQSLRKTNKRLKQVSALKDEFVSLTSHELRTPLTAIGGSLSTVLEGYAGKVGDKTREFLEGAYSENTRLLRLVNNFLNISRIEARRLKFNIVPLNLNEVATAALETIKTQAEEKKLKLIFEPQENLIVQADEDKLREIIINLCANAIKFTEAGQVTFTAWRQGEMVIVAVEDTGRGIMPQDQQKLFRKFEQVDGIKASKKKGGTGLGLYICKNLIEGMGGEIWLNSEHNKGSTFYFTLPLK